MRRIIIVSLDNQCPVIFFCRGAWKTIMKRSVGSFVALNRRAFLIVYPGLRIRNLALFLLCILCVFP